MSDFLLAKPKLPPDVLDVSVGEPHVVRDILLKTFRVNGYALPQPHHIWEYPHPTGYLPLVGLLEDQYQHPVIITNGAKQALGACFYALHKMSKVNVGMLDPYWALIPPLMKMHGLIPAPGRHPFNVDAYLVLAPNNPDGQLPYLDCLEEACKSQDIPLIHDAAYYTHSYLPPSMELKTYGDVQIFSISKMFGLSGLRLGYVVCPNHDFYRLIQEYMEAMTVGVSITSQLFLFDLLTQMKSHPEKLLSFEKEANRALSSAKEKMLQVDPSILEVDPRFVDKPGMFGWFKVGPKANFKKSKINVVDGALFGGPGFVRLNLAFDEEQMNDIVKRLNSALG